MPFARVVTSALCAWAALPTAAVRLQEAEASASDAVAAQTEASLLETAADTEYTPGSGPPAEDYYRLVRYELPQNGEKLQTLTEMGRQAKGEKKKPKHQHEMTGSAAPRKLTRHAGPVCAHAALREIDPALLPVAAQHIAATKHSALFIGVPREWTDLFVEGSVRFLGRRHHRREFFVARLAAAPEKQVTFQCSPSDLKSTLREVHVVNVLNASRAETGEHGSIETVFEVRSASGTTYLLEEGGDVTLEDYINSNRRSARYSPQDARSRFASGQWSGMALPLEASIPILLDVLRGCRELEGLGLTHGALSPENVFIVADRAFLRGLSSICRCGRTDPHLSCDALEDTAPFWQPPESWSGSPCTAEDHTWGLGMIFAYMCLGYSPVEKFFDTRHGRYQDMGEVRAALAWFFTIDESPHFWDLDEDVRRILLGMLAPVHQRWNTRTALSQIEALAAARGIAVPGPRVRPALSVERRLSSWSFSVGSSESSESSW